MRLSNLTTKFWRITLAWVLALGICLPILGKILILTNFILHQERIAEERCRYRLEPQIMCKGVCVLQAQLQVYEDAEQEGGGLSLLDYLPQLDGRYDVPTGLVWPNVLGICGLEPLVFLGEVVFGPYLGGSLRGAIRAWTPPPQA